jgi:plasmid stabilization system protein ParE
MNYRLTKSAQRDIQAITSFILKNQRSPQNAKLVAERLRAMFHKLARNPNLGHIRKELADDRIRAIAVSGVLVIYDPDSRPLTILRVIHGARNLENIEPE